MDLWLVKLTGPKRVTYTEIGIFDAYEEAKKAADDYRTNVIYSDFQLGMKLQWFHEKEKNVEVWTAFYGFEEYDISIVNMKINRNTYNEKGCLFHSKQNLLL